MTQRSSSAGGHPKQILRHKILSLGHFCQISVLCHAGMERVRWEDRQGKKEVLEVPFVTELLSCCISECVESCSKDRVQL